MAFGTTLRRLREAAGLTQQQLADQAGISKRTLEGWEQGRNRPRLDVLPALAEALGVAVGALLADLKGPGAKRPRGRPTRPKPGAKGQAPQPKKRRKPPS